MVTHENGFPTDPPISKIRKSAFINLNEPGESPPYGADDCLTDFDCLDKAKGGTHCKGEDVYMNIDDVWYYVIRWDTAEREVYLIEKGLVKVEGPGRFIVSSKEFHLTKVR